MGQEESADAMLSQVNLDLQREILGFLPPCRGIFTGGPPRQSQGPCSEG